MRFAATTLLLVLMLVALAAVLTTVHLSIQGLQIATVVLQHRCQHIGIKRHV
jgi:hypothetical protein